MKCLVLLGLLLLGWSASAQQTYHAPEVRSVSDAYVPYQIIVDGLFVLDVSINEDGSASRVVALRNPGAMLGAAENSLRSWKFQPASDDGQPEASRITISFVYRPTNSGNFQALPPKNFSPALPASGAASRDRGGYVPAGILAFAYPEYPVNSVAWGSVVVQLSLDASGEVKNVEFLHPLDNFNGMVSEALKKWHFRPAMFGGKPIASKMAIAFIFQPPTSN